MLLEFPKYSIRVAAFHAACNQQGFGDGDQRPVQRCGVLVVRGLNNFFRIPKVSADQLEYAGAAFSRSPAGYREVTDLSPVPVEFRLVVIAWDIRMSFEHFLNMRKSH